MTGRVNNVGNNKDWFGMGQKLYVAALNTVQPEFAFIKHKFPSLFITCVPNHLFLFVFCYVSYKCIIHMQDYVILARIFISLLLFANVRMLCSLGNGSRASYFTDVWAVSH